jgi:hypothetical protein
LTGLSDRDQPRGGAAAWLSAWPIRAWTPSQRRARPSASRTVLSGLS